MLAVQMCNKGTNQQKDHVTSRDQQGRPTHMEQAEKGPVGENEARTGSPWGLLLTKS